MVNPPPGNVYLFPVPSQKIEGLPSELLQLWDKEGNTYDVLDFFTYKKTEPWPGGMMLLATGKEVEPERVWAAYPGSDRLYFFIARKIS